jgi:alpha-mannosidase
MTFPAGPEAIVFIDGAKVGAIDMQHNQIAHPFKPGKSYQVQVVWFAGRANCRHRLTGFSLAQVDPATDRLHHHLRVAKAVIDRTDASSVGREKLMRAIEAAMAKLDVREHFPPAAGQAVRRDPQHELFYASVGDAVEAFENALGELKTDPDAPAVTCVGHAHIDLAWMWPVRHTRQKIVRTFATQLRNIGRYDDWVYNQSSPQAYAWLESDAPDLFERVSKQVAAGRWEADGATWVEMDTNVPSGESLVRQLLYGKMYFKEKFNFDSRMLWLPDVFGYSAALPQLLKLAGVDTFVTSKISWSQYNRFPHDAFRWRGIDGSEVASTFIGTPVAGVGGTGASWGATYNANMTPGEIADTWESYRQKNHLIEPLCSYGHGDGGGGPTEQMHETALRLSQWPLPAGMPRVNRRKAGELAAEVASRAAELPVWDGELYLEYHRGTLTSQAWLKRANRKMEIALHDLEWLGVAASKVGHASNNDKISEIWKDLLYVQFHDILPGSSVHEVYDDTRKLFEQRNDEVATMTGKAIDALTDAIDTSGYQEPIVLFNTLGWDRTDPVKLPSGQWIDSVTVPASGWTVVDAAKPRVTEQVTVLTVSDDGKKLVNQWWELLLNDQGQVVELRDRKNNRQVLRAGEVGNAWQVFADRSMAYENWDIDLAYEDEPLPGPVCESMTVVEQSDVRVAVEVAWKMPMIGEDASLQSTITQRIVLYAGHPRIDFETTADWHEHHQLLKLAWPIDVRATEATYEIQFGHIRRPTHRNTSWDLAKFECCGHRFIDLSEHGYGVSLLNDCKYGYDVHDGVMRLTAIKATQQPDATADQGEHVFTYSLLPHADTFQNAGVVRAAAELNTPVIAAPTQPAEGKLPAEHRPITVDNPAVVIDTIKPAEDGKGVIVRLYESHGSHATATINLDKAPQSAEGVDLLEQPAAMPDLLHEGASIKLTLKPFEVRSLRLT